MTTSLSDRHSKGSWERLHSGFARMHPAEEFLGSSDLAAVACLLLDLAMPGMSGLDVMQQLGARGLRIPTVVVTAHADGDVEQHLVAAGAIAILPKPVDHQLLLRLVQRMVGEP
jgi:two-component system, LuxR family, response regulator FixJ